QAAEALRVATLLVAERTETAATAATAQAEAAADLPPLRETESAKSAALQRLVHQRDDLDAEEARAREAAQRMRQRVGQAEQDLIRERGLEQDAATALGDLRREAEGLEA